MASNSTVKKTLLVAILIGIGATLFVYVAGIAYVRSQNLRAVSRAQRLAVSIQKLRVGRSDYRAAQAIAADFGAVPYENCFGGRDCRDGYFEGCTYVIPANDNWSNRLLSKHPFLRRLGLREWAGTALIYIGNGLVQEYSFSIAYWSRSGTWRGFGAEEGKSIPTDRAVQALISGAYSIERNDILMGGQPGGLGFELQSSLTPASTPGEQKHAWHFEFGCLAERDGCGEICEVMPDVWHDFYNIRGHFDVEKYGPACMFCTKH
jgi:hypothetical protein